jgi:hypothetical protein
MYYDRDLKIIRTGIRVLLALTLASVAPLVVQQLWWIVSASALWCGSYVLLLRYTTSMQKTRDTVARLQEAVKQNRHAQTR